MGGSEYGLHSYPERYDLFVLLMPISRYLSRQAGSADDFGSHGGRLGCQIVELKRDGDCTKLELVLPRLFRFTSHADLWGDINRGHGLPSRHPKLLAPVALPPGLLRGFIFAPSDPSILQLGRWLIGGQRKFIE